MRYEGIEYDVPANVPNVDAMHRTKHTLSRKLLLMAMRC